MIEWGRLAALIDKARSDDKAVVLGTHVHADGDGLGSQIGLYHHLKDTGVRTHIINNDPVDPRYAFLQGAERIVVHDGQRSSDLIRNAAVFVTLDNSSPERLGRLLPDVKAGGATKVCIDHHADTDPFWDLNCVDREACASGQLVYEAIKSFGGRITPPIAEALYVSFVMDTGHFRFPKTTPRVHEILAELMEVASINPQRFYRALFEDVPPGFNRLIGHALLDAHYEYDGRFAWARLTRRQLQECDGFEQDTGDLVNMLLAVAGVQAAALFKDIGEGQTKVSLRSLGDVDVNELAGRFGGGGHKNASGILMSDPLDEGVRKVVEAMADILPPVPVS